MRQLAKTGNFPRKEMRPAAPQVIMWPLADEDTILENDPGGSNHFHWVVTAFHDYEENLGNFRDTVTVNVEAPSEETAIARAMKIVKRANYRVSSVTEICSKDSLLRE